jgi:hypothetical protein
MFENDDELELKFFDLCFVRNGNLICVWKICVNLSIL